MLFGQISRWAMTARDLAGIAMENARLLTASNSTNVRLTRQKSTLCQWLAVPLWVPKGKDSVPTDSGAFRSQFRAMRGSW